MLPEARKYQRKLICRTGLDKLTVLGKLHHSQPLYVPNIEAKLDDKQKKKKRNKEEKKNLSNNSIRLLQKKKKIDCFFADRNIW